MLKYLKFYHFKNENKFYFELLIYQQYFDRKFYNYLRFKRFSIEYNNIIDYVNWTLDA